jgi:hypothetical protein
MRLSRHPPDGGFLAMTDKRMGDEKGAHSGALLAPLDSCVRRNDTSYFIVITRCDEVFCGVSRRMM